MLWTLALACFSQEERLEVGQQRLEDQMEDHWAAVGRAREAVVRGDVPAARAAAGEVAAAVPMVALPERLRPQEQGLLAAARSTADAIEPDEVARGVGRMVAACGACHQAQGLTLELESWPLPGAGGDVRSQMARHAWAAERVEQGLITGREQAFDEALGALVDAPMIPTGTPVDGRGFGDAVMLEIRVHDLAAQAARADAEADRARIYGELLTTCASCHALVRSSPGR